MEKKKKRKSREEGLSMLASAEYLENFAAEFSKHEVLMSQFEGKKKVGEVQEACKRAFRQIGKVFSLKDWRAARVQSIYFKNQCIQKMRRFVRLSLARGGSGHDALQLAPVWLQKLNPVFNLLNTALRYESLDDGSMQATRKRMINFTWELYATVRDAVRAAPRPTDALRGHDAVQRYADKIGLSFDMLHQIWSRLFQLSLHKLIEVRNSGDRPEAAHRPSQLEWRLIDLALMYDVRIIVVHDDSFTNSQEMQAMIQLYKLMCDAQIKFDGLLRGNQNKDMPHIECQESGGRTSGTRERTARKPKLKGPLPSCSKEPDGEDSLLWENEEMWSFVRTEYTKRGRTASLVLLQRRWHELRQLTRRRLLDAFREREPKPHPLLLAIAKRFPSVVTSPLPSWSWLVGKELVFTDATVPLLKHMDYSDDVIPVDASLKDVTTDLLDWSDDEIEIIEENREVIDIASDSDSEHTNDDEHTNDAEGVANLLHEPRAQLAEENSIRPVQNKETIILKSNIISYPTTIKQEKECAGESIPQIEPDKEENKSISITEVTDTTLPLDKLDPKKTKVRIIFEDDSDLEELDRMCCDESMFDGENKMDEINEKIANICNEFEIKNKNVINESDIVKKRSDIAINDNNSSLDNKTDRMNEYESNANTETDKSNKNPLVECNKSNETDVKYENVSSIDNQMDKSNENDSYLDKMNETNKNQNGDTHTIEHNENLIQNTDQILCQGNEKSSTSHEGQTSEECGDTTIKSEDNVTESVNSGKVPEEIMMPNIKIETNEERIDPNDSSVKSVLTERPNVSFNTDIKMVIKKTVIANFYKMIGSDILNIPPKKIDQNPANNSRLIKHTQELFEYTTNTEQISSSSDEAENRHISDIRSIKSEAEADDDASIIDMKLLKLSRVVLTPVDDVPLWRARSRNGSINCRSFSVRAFSAAPMISSRMLPFCRRYNPTSTSHQAYSPSSCAYLPAHRRPTGLQAHSTRQLAALPPDIKTIRNKLTKHLKLSRTYYTSEFWRDIRNLEQLAMCIPVSVRMDRLASRVVKKVELANIDEVRRINKTILTAQVAPNNVTSIRTLVANEKAKRTNESGTLADTFVTISPSTPPTIAPTEEELKKMIKGLVLPSIKAHDECPRRESSTAGQRTSVGALWRIDDKKLEKDIRDVVKMLSDMENSEEAKMLKKVKRKKKIEKNIARKVSEQPLDAYAEWQRQKTCTHKYFNFTTPGSSSKGKDKQADRPKLVEKETNKKVATANINPNANNEMVNLVCASDDEDNALVICEDTIDDEENVPVDKTADTTLSRIDSLKRPNAENESENYKRKKLSTTIGSEKLALIDLTLPNSNKSTSTNSTLYSFPKMISSNSTFLGTQKTMSPSSTVLNPQNLTPLNTLSSPQTMSSLNSMSPCNQNLTLNSSLTNSDKLASPSSTISLLQKFTNSSNTSNSLKLATLRPALVSSETPTLLNSTLPSPEKPLSLKSTFFTSNKITQINSKLPFLKKPLKLTSILRPQFAAQSQTGSVTQTKQLFKGLSPGSLIHNAVIVGLNKPVTLKVVTSSQSLLSLAQPVTTENTVGKNENNFSVQDKIIHPVDANVGKTDASKDKPHIILDATVKSKDSSDVVSRDNSDGSIKEELDVIPIITTYTISDDKAGANESSVLHTPNITKSSSVVYGTSSGSNAKVETEASHRMGDVTSLGDKDNVPIMTNNYDKTDVVPSESHIKEINPTVNCELTESETIVISPNLFENNDKLNSAETKIDDSHSSGGEQSPNTMPVISSVSSLASRIKVKDEFKITNFDLRQESSPIATSDGSPLDTQEPEPKLVTNECFEIEEKDSLVKREDSRDSPLAFNVQVKREKVETIGGDKPGSEKSKTVRNVQSKKKTRSRREESDDGEGGESAKNGGCPKTLLLGIATTHDEWTAASEAHSNQRTVNDTNLHFRSVTDLGEYAANVSEYAAKVSNPDEPLLKVDAARAWWLLQQKYVLLTDERVRCARAVYLTSLQVDDIAPYTVLLFPPPDGRRLTLNMGAKKGRDVIVCGCLPGRDRCPLCEGLAQREREPASPPAQVACVRCGVSASRARTPLLRLRQRAYRKVSDRPLKYVQLEPRRECRRCDGVQYVADPETVLINGKAYERISSEPLMYSPVLSVVQDPQRCSSLVKSDAELYLLNLRTSQRRRLMYHVDDKHEGFNKAVSLLMTKLDREETDSWCRVQMDKSGIKEY